MAGWMKMNVSDWDNENDMNGQSGLKPEYPYCKYHRLVVLWMMEEVSWFKDESKTKMKKEQDTSRQKYA